MKNINEYNKFLEELKEVKNSSTLDILTKVSEEYKNVRIENTNVDSDGDMLLVQWCNKNAEKVLTITRQIIQTENSNTEFDNTALQINIELYFKNSKHLLNAGNVWIENPDLVIEKFEAICNVKYLEDILNLVPDRIVTNHFKI